jgi:hypothetical protein
LSKACPQPSNDILASERTLISAPIAHNQGKTARYSAAAHHHRHTHLVATFLIMPLQLSAQ